jgi:hypothetical protein
MLRQVGVSSRLLVFIGKYSPYNRAVCAASNPQMVLGTLCGDELDLHIKAEFDHRANQNQYLIPIMGPEISS